MCAPYIKLESLKSYTVRLWEKIYLKQQENLTDRINYEVQSSWTVTSCFWEEIINGQHKVSKWTGWAQNRDGRMSRSTWLNKLESNIAMQWTMCRGSVNRLTELHFPFGLDEFYPYLSAAEKNWPCQSSFSWVLDRWFWMIGWLFLNLWWSFNINFFHVIKER